MAPTWLDVDLIIHEHLYSHLMTPHQVTTSQITEAQLLNMAKLETWTTLGQGYNCISIIQGQLTSVQVVKWAPDLNAVKIYIHVLHVTELANT